MPNPDLGVGYLMIGDTLVGASSGFIGSGKLALLEVQLVAAPLAHGQLFSTLAIDNVDTWVLDSHGDEIPALKTDGSCLYEWKVKVSKVTDNTGATTFHGVFVGVDDADTQGSFEESAKEMHDLLDPANGDPYKGWSAANKKLLAGATATKAEIEKAIKEAKDKAQPCNEFIFYFCGHGSNGGIGPGPNGKLDTPPAGDDEVKVDPNTGKKYIYPGKNGKIDSTPVGDDTKLPDGSADTDGDEPDGFDNCIEVGGGDIITDDELARMLSGFNYSVTIVAILDCCYSGTFTDGTKDLKSITQKKNGVDSPIEAGHLEVLMASPVKTEGHCYKWNDKNGNGKVDPGELEGPILWWDKNKNGKVDAGDVIILDKSKPPNGKYDPGVDEIVPIDKVKWKNDFTYELLNGLKKDGKDNNGVDSTSADGNKDGVTTAKELFDGAQSKTKQWYESDSDNDGRKDEDGAEYIITEEGGHYIMVDDDGDGWVDEDPPLDQLPAYFEIGHNIAVRHIELSKTVVGLGRDLSFNITVTNQGNYTEVFDVEVYLFMTPIYSESVYLTGGNRTTFNFTLSTLGLTRGNYIIGAYAEPVSNETDVNDNMLADVWVFVTIVGDVNCDRIVDIFDIVSMAVIYGVRYPDPLFRSNCDLNENGQIDIFDIVLAAGNFGASW